MHRTIGSPFISRALACWNWKCALFSATVRSAVYLAAMAHSNLHGGLTVVAVELGYVSFTGGLYAGLQQRALSFRSRLLGNLTIVVGVPGLAQALDWLTHRAAHAAAPAKAIVVLCVFSTISAIFHLHVMRRGAFITGSAGRTLADDFRRMPRLIVEFVVRPITVVGSFAARWTRTAESEAALQAPSPWGQGV
jgi:hypothetical protein